MTPLEHALDLAARGRRVFPMNPATKRPRCEHGKDDATTDAAKLRQWFTRPGSVPAVATGTASDIAVLDIDRQHGGEIWWNEHRTRLPETEAYRTKNGGLHLVFRYRPEARTVPLGDIAPGIELRGDGASAIYWPAAGLPILSDAVPAPLPQWLIPPPKAAWTPPAAAPWAGDDHRARAYGMAALRRAIDRVATAAPGTRNQTLNAETYGLLRLTDCGGLHAGEVAEAMAHAGLAAGLGRKEIEATLRSALTARGGAA